MCGAGELVRQFALERKRKSSERYADVTFAADLCCA